MRFLIVVLLLASLAHATWVKQMENKNTASLLGEDNEQFVEGDIRMRKAEYEEMLTGSHVYGSQVGGRWPDPTRIPYVIHSSLQNVTKATKRIAAAIDDYRKLTCLQLVPRTTERNYIIFGDFGMGCSSPVGYGQNKISLVSGCWRKGTIMHEIGHSLGLWHEQSRPDRDDHVKIQFQNIKDSLKYNFDKMNGIDSLGTKYDYLSLMHYSRYAFTENGNITIETIKPEFQNQIGQRRGLSKIDIEQIKLMYPTLPATCSTWIKGHSCPLGKIRTAFDGETGYDLGRAKAECENACDKEAKCQFASLYKSQDCYLHSSRCGDWENNKPSTYHLYKTTDATTCTDESLCNNFLERHCPHYPPLKEKCPNLCNTCQKSPTDATPTSGPRNTDLDCNFDENTFCKWTAPRTPHSGSHKTWNKDQWILNKGSTETPKTGPNTDASGNGYYAYMEGNTWCPSVTLKSATMTTSTNCMLNLAYHMKGQSIGKLEVFQRTASNQLKQLFTKNKQQGGQWLRAKVQIPPGSNFKLEIKASRRANGSKLFITDIAIDEITSDCAGVVDGGGVL